MSMSYPIKHPYGHDGYRIGILVEDVMNNTYLRIKFAMWQIYKFQLQQRLNKGHTLLQVGRLLEQYVVHGYITIEEEIFC